jgi:hypothetical protein
MKVLVATHESQGAREDDFDGCVEGELVWVQEACGRDRSGGSDCGCGRAFAGVASHRGTTTATIRDLPGMTFPRYVQALEDSFEAQGWPKEWAPEVAQDLLHYARTWPVETVLERNLDFIGVRFDPSTGELRPRQRFSFGQWSTM